MRLERSARLRESAEAGERAGPSSPRARGAPAAAAAPARSQRGALGLPGLEKDETELMLRARVLGIASETLLVRGHDFFTRPDERTHAGRLRGGELGVAARARPRARHRARQLLELGDAVFGERVCERKYGGTSVGFSCCVFSTKRRNRGIPRRIEAGRRA